MTPGLPAPEPTPETRPYWEAARRKELLLPFCPRCEEFFFYPRAYCPACGGAEVDWRRASGRGRLHTYVISHRGTPGYEGEAPYIIALVELEEGPRLLTNLLGVDPDPARLRIDMALEVIFLDRGEYTLPQFRPSPEEVTA